MTFNAAYTGARQDLVELVPAECRRVLDLGCAAGDFGAALKARRPGVVVAGIERDAGMAGEATAKLDDVVVGDIDDLPSVDGQLVHGPFDCLVFGDVLEHLVDPWRALRNSLELLAPDGFVVASIPNVGHIDTYAQLLVRRRWPYRPRGIHDATHLRQFAAENVRSLFAEAELRILSLHRTYRLIERPHPWNRFAYLLALPGPIRELLTYQFLVVARSEASARQDPASPL